MDHLNVNALDLGREQRGYLLTQNLDYLRRFHDMEKRLRKNFEQIKQMAK
jgi:CHASE3 domain sensor protein